MTEKNLFHFDNDFINIFKTFTGIFYFTFVCESFLNCVLHQDSVVYFDTLC